MFAKDRNDVIGLLFTKDLIFIDPDDETPLKNFVQIFGRAVTVRAENQPKGCWRGRHASVCAICFRFVSYAIVLLQVARRVAGAAVV